jgi:hypothetical protein
MSRIWWVGFLALTATVAAAEGRPAGNLAGQVERSVETWNRQHRGAWSIRLAGDPELAGLLYQWDETLPDCRECQIVDVRVTEVDGEAEVSYRLEGDAAASGATRLSVSSQRLARK